MENTSYDITPLPTKPLSADIEKAFKTTKINMEALFLGENPLESKGDVESQPGFDGGNKPEGVLKSEDLPF